MNLQFIDVINLLDPVNRTVGINEANKHNKNKMNNGVKMYGYPRVFYTFSTKLTEKKTKIALNQVFVPKLALKVKSHKNST